MKKICERRVHYVTEVTRVYDSGLTEVSVYCDEVIAGAGQILMGIITKQPGTGMPWWAYPASINDKRKFTSRKKAFSFLWDYIKTTDAGRIHWAKHFPDSPS